MIRLQVSASSANGEPYTSRGVCTVRRRGRNPLAYGFMGGGSTVGNPGDELTGHKVGSMGSDDASPTSNEPASGAQKYIGGKLYMWVPGFGWIEYSGKPSVGITAEDMYENGNKIGSMGGEEPQDSDASSPPTEQPESTSDEIHIVFVETPEKNSTPPPYKPDTTCP